jgi:hypothetical protein
VGESKVLARLLFLVERIKALSDLFRHVPIDLVEVREVLALNSELFFERLLNSTQ